jgi:hypothetical protein
MVSRKSGYEDTWEAFLSKINHYSPNQRRALNEEATIDEKLLLIHGVARYWVETQNAEDLAGRKQRRLVAAQKRAAEERRLAIDESARRDYLDEATRGMLPPMRIQVQPHDDVLRDRRTARSFWRSIDSGNVRGRTVASIIEREKISGRALAAARPYGPPVEAERLAAFAKDLRRWRDGGIVPTLDERMRLYTPRAAKQVAHMLVSRL